MASLAPVAPVRSTRPSSRSRQNGRQSDPCLGVDPSDAARAAGLRYVSDSGPGIRRKQSGKRFTYFDVEGEPVRDERELARIKSLVIPPAWTEVWICPSPRGHIQATGRDARGRKQYRYHPRWREVRDETKYGRLRAFGEALPGLRQRVDRDLSLPGLAREKVLATVVRLLETTLIRIGNEEYARTNESYGLTTLHDEHVDVHGATVQFSFRGKSGKEHTVGVRDRRLAGIVKRCRDLPGQDLFQYRTPRVRRTRSGRPTSTLICARRWVRSSPPRTSAPGPAASWRRKNCCDANRRRRRRSVAATSSRRSKRFRSGSATPRRSVAAATSIPR